MSFEPVFSSNEILYKPYGRIGIIKTSTKKPVSRDDLTLKWNELNEELEEFLRQQDEVPFCNHDLIYPDPIVEHSMVVEVMMHTVELKACKEAGYSVVQPVEAMT